MVAVVITAIDVVVTLATVVAVEDCLHKKFYNLFNKMLLHKKIKQVNFA